MMCELVCDGGHRVMKPETHQHPSVLQTGFVSI